MLLNNPIFKREFISAARSSRTVFFVMLYICSLAFVLLAMWPGGGVLSVVSESGKRIFELFFSVNLTVLILLVPAFSATSITQERESETYSALSMTLLTPLEIMAGKLASSVLLLLILIFMSMPIAAITALTGGISLGFLAKVMLLLVVTAVSYGLLGLACSSFCRKNSTAILANYVLIVLFAGATWLPNALLGNIIGFKSILQAFRSVSPYDAMFYLLNPDTYNLSLSVISANSIISPFNIFILSSLLISVVSFMIFFGRILKPPAKFAKTQQKYADAKTALKRKLTWPFYLIDPLKRKKPIGRFSNPVYVAELRNKLFSNPKLLVRAISAILILSLVMLVLVAMQVGEKISPERVWAAAIIFQIGIVALLTPALSSGLITDEISNNTLTDLRMTPITPLTFILGKLKATFFYALIFIVTSLFILFAMLFLETQTVFPEGSIFAGAWWTELFKRASHHEWWVNFWTTYRRIVVWVVILLLSCLTFLSGGIFASSISRKSSVATAIAYSITAFICVITLAPLVLAERLSHQVARTILSFNPIICAMQISFGVLPQYSEIWKTNIFILISLSLIFMSIAAIRTWHIFSPFFTRKMG